jgi:hypothetical protein
MTKAVPHYCAFIDSLCSDEAGHKRDTSDKLFHIAAASPYLGVLLAVYAKPHLQRFHSSIISSLSDRWLPSHPHEFDQLY